MKKLKTAGIFLLVVFLSLNCFVFSAESNAVVSGETSLNVYDEVDFLKDISQNHVCRLYDEETYLNQAVFLNEDQSVTNYIFKNPIKYVDQNNNLVDLADHIVLPDSEVVFRQNISFRVQMKKSSDNTLFANFSNLGDLYHASLQITEANIIFLQNSSNAPHSAIDITQSIKTYDRAANYVSVLKNTPATATQNLYDIYDDFVIAITSSSPYPETLANGHYFMSPDTTFQLCADSNASTTNEVFLWNFTGTNTQVWQVTRNIMHGAYLLKNVHNNKYLTYYSNGNVGVSATGSYFVISKTFFNASSPYTVVPLDYAANNSKAVSFVSPASGSNIQLSNVVGGFSAGQRWAFDQVTELGAAGPYRNVTSKKINCLGYALRLNEWGDLSIQFGDSVYDVCEETVAYINNLPKNCRVLESGTSYTSFVRTNEYRIALRIGEHTITRKLLAIDGTVQTITQRIIDYHFMEHLNTGKWAHKPGEAPSINGITNPETYNWYLRYSTWNVNLNQYVEETYNQFYDSTIIYIAVAV